MKSIKFLLCMSVIAMAMLCGGCDKKAESTVETPPATPDRVVFEQYLNPPHGYSEGSVYLDTETGRRYLLNRYGGVIELKEKDAEQ